MQTNNFLKEALAAVTAAVMLAGCASTPAPVVDHSFGGSSGSQSGGQPQPSASQPVAGEGGVQTFGTGHANGTITASGYAVAPDDTLYSIAFANGVDFRVLAAMNNIPPPYIIHPGQVLKLQPSTATPATTTVAAGTTTITAATQAPVAQPVAAQPATRPAAPVFGPVTTQPMTASGVASAASVGAPAVATAMSTPAAVPVTTSPPESAQPVVSTPPPGATRNVAGINWRWPASGKVIGDFHAGVSGDGSGLDIGGNVGDPVRAAADGTIVYSGNGLIGYGELIIIKHNDSYLSAYGHNSKRLAKEGQRVDAGQEIALMGATGAPRVELHFEIRKNGKPVDPMAYLPQR